MRYPNIQAERARADLTMDELAYTLGVTRRTLYRWMSQGHIPQSHLDKMATLFDCSVDYLLGITNDRAISMYKYNTPRQ